MSNSTRGQMKGQRGIDTYSKLHNMFTVSTLLFGQTKYKYIALSLLFLLSLPPSSLFLTLTLLHMMNVWCVCCPCYQWQRFLTSHKQLVICLYVEKLIMQKQVSWVKLLF